VSRLLRWLRVPSTVRVDSGEAVDVARAECQRRGIPWLEPVRVHRHYGNWTVWTHADRIGGNVRVVVDAGTGDVLKVNGPTPR
jgi:hypothetical protein